MFMYRHSMTVKDEMIKLHREFYGYMSERLNSS